MGSKCLRSGSVVGKREVPLVSLLGDSVPFGHKTGRCDCLEKEDLGCGVNLLQEGTKLGKEMELFFIIIIFLLMNVDPKRELTFKPSKITSS